MHRMIKAKRLCRLQRTGAIENFPRFLMKRREMINYKEKENHTMKKILRCIFAIMAIILFFQAGCSNINPKDTARKELEKKNLKFDGDTFVSLAESGDISTMKLFLDAGMDPNVKDKGYGATAMHRAARRNSKEMAELLLSKGADINAKSTRDRTPLHVAVYYDHKEMVIYLLSKGADLKAKNDEGQTPFHLAISYAGKDVAEILLSKGADINAQNKDLESPLFIIMLKGIKDYKPISEWLISKGADINLPNHKGETPLHVCAIFNYKDLAEILISKGADINAKDKKGQTPLKVALNKKSMEVVDVLKKHGAAMDDKAEIVPEKKGKKK